MNKDFEHIIEETSKVEMPSFDKNRAWKKVEAEISGKAPLKLYLKKAIKIAAVVATALIIGAISTRYFVKSDKYVEINARKGQKIDVTLPDGSRIWINAGCKVKYPSNYGGINKQIFVSGEAYVEIKEQSFIPVTIVVKEYTLQCFEGAINVNANQSEGAEITVADGWATLNNQENGINNVLVEQGSTCFMNKEICAINNTNDVNYLAWKTGKLVFDKAPLILVAQTLSEYFGIPVETVGEMRYCKFTSQYKNAELSTILNDIKRALNPEIKQNSKSVCISGDDC